jgi:hypothetical protein
MASLQIQQLQKLGGAGLFFKRGRNCKLSKRNVVLSVLWFDETNPMPSGASMDIANKARVRLWLRLR